MPSTTPQILLTGATGYIGGAVLAHLVNSPSPTLRNATITCLIRGADRAATLSSTYGSRVKPIVYKDLDDLEATTAAAAQHDLVINTTLGFHAASAQALIRGLAQRKASTGRDVWMIQTSGTSNLGARPISGTYVEPDGGREFDDERDDVYGYERRREALHPYPQRATELGVVDAGLELGVHTLVVMAPTIFGLGSGLFNRISIQIPTYVRSALDHGRAVVVGEGKGVNGHVHVEDLADLFALFALRILDQGGRDLPRGEKGIVFSCNGRFEWGDVAQGVADACYEAGKIPDRTVHSVDLAEGARVLTSYRAATVDEENVELGLSSGARTVASVARRLGWSPTRGEDAWRQGFADDLMMVLRERE